MTPIIPLDRPCRSLEEYLAELVERYDALPETRYSARGKLQTRIRAVEAEINARSGL
jgi:hypothetical protein